MKRLRWLKRKLTENTTTISTLRFLKKLSGTPARIIEDKTTGEKYYLLTDFV